MAMTFSGFDDDALGFLADLRANNSRDFFAANRPRYEAMLESGKEYVTEAGKALTKIAPEVHAEPRINGSIFRINRDIRFSRDKTPYKDTFDFWFWAGERKGALSGFFARVSPDEFGVGVGAHGLDSGSLKRFRAAVAAPCSGAELSRVAKKLSRSGIELEGAHYKRMPRDFDDSGPAAEFLLYDSLSAYVSHDPNIVTDGKAVMAASRKVWRSLAPVHNWLMGNVADPDA